ncbi:MAG: peptidoglycan DD-metalloendopeptidase family protein [Syntrophaceae bacterium]
MSRHVFAATLLVLALSAQLLAAPEEQRLKELGQKVKVTDAKRRSVEDGLRVIDGRIAAIQKDLDQRQADIDNRTRLLNDYGARIREYDSSLADTREHFKHKAIGFYKGALIDTLDLTLAHTELTGYLSAAVARDRETLDYYQRVSRMKKAAQQGLKDQTRALNQDLEQLAARMRELETEKGKKKVLLAALKQETLSYQQEIERLMERIQARKKKEQEAYTGIARNKGSLPWPVDGRVVRRFGRFRDNGVVQISQGIDIRTAAAAPVKSIFKGKVAYVGAIDRFGTTVIVDHGGGYYSIYGNLGRGLKKAGEAVQSRETIALSGTQAPLLHFEIRLHGKPQDPSLWLVNGKKAQSPP